MQRTLLRKKIVSVMKKYIDKSWYIVYDGTSFYGVLGMDIEDTLQGDSDIVVVSGPYREYPEVKIEQLNVILN